MCVGAALGRNAGMGMGPALGVFLGPTDGIGYGTGEGTQYSISVGADEDNPLGKNKGREGRSNAGLCPLCSPCCSGRGFAAVPVWWLGGHQE